MTPLPMATESDTTADLEDSGIDLGDNEVGEVPNDDAVHVASRCVGSGVRGVVARWRVTAVLVALLLSAGMVAGLYVGQYRIDEQTSAAAVAAVSAASEGSVALLSYAPATVDGDLVAAQSHLTGEFLTYYRDFANQIVGPAAKQKAVHASASVVRAAPAEIRTDTAKVVIFLNQTTTSRENPEPVQSATSVMVGLTKVDEHWLISSFDPM